MEKEEFLFSKKSHIMSIMFYLKTHTVLSTFNLKNMRFLKFCLKILRRWESIFGLKESITGVWGSTSSESPSVHD